MRFNKDDLPYLYKHSVSNETLPSGIERQLAWEYRLEQSTRLYIAGDDYPVIVEQVRYKRRYRFDDYQVMAITVDEWQYLEKQNEQYSGTMQGYRGYWDGMVLRNNEPVLQPEVGVMLGFSPEPESIPPYIELVSLDNLLTLMQTAYEKYADDDLLAFHKPLPIATPPDAPPQIVDALRRMRAQTRLSVTRGRAALLEYVMKTTGTVAHSGGWKLTEEELQRRTKGA